MSNNSMLDYLFSEINSLPEPTVGSRRKELDKLISDYEDNGLNYVHDVDNNTYMRDLKVEQELLNKMVEDDPDSINHGI